MFKCLPVPPSPAPALPASVSGCASRGVRAVRSGAVVVAVVCLIPPHPLGDHGWLASFAAGTAGGVLGPPVTSTLDMRAPGVRRSGPVRGVVSSAAVALAQRLAQRLAASGVGLTPPVQLGLGV